MVPSSSPAARDVLRRLAGAGGRSPVEALRGIAVETSEIEDFRPMAESLEWRLAGAYWEGGGALPFVRNDVPYLINNTGRLSENSAALAFAALTEAGPSLPRALTFLELGAGTGLHACYFLDAFAALCQREGSDLYQRMTYVVSDRSTSMVAGWRKEGLFARHEGHVALALCDARAPGDLRTPDGQPLVPPAPPVLVFCNYVLDVLPSRIVRRSPAGIEQLCVRTHLARGTASLRAAGIASLDEARALAASGRPDDLRRLLPLLPLLELETAFQPWTPDAAAQGMVTEALAAREPAGAEAGARPAGGERVILNDGALDCLDQILKVLGDPGFIVINDYGPVRPQDVGAHVGVQRFGGSVALGLNFPLIERALAARGLTVAAADSDEQRRVHTRLGARRAAPRATEVLRQRFSAEADRRMDAPHEEARGHLGAGRRNEALEAYRQAVESNPGDWQILGEAAEYVGLQLGDHTAGLELARAALERNPWYSPWLWNILGDCLFYRDRLADAHDAFMQALRIDPDDPRSNLNVAFTLSSSGDQAGALAAIARGLANDGRNLYRARLLEKQTQILAAVSERASAEQATLARRAERFR